MTFQIDTFGSVGEMPGWQTPVPTCERFMRWSDLTPFTQGYIEAMFADIDPPATQDTAHSTPKGFSDLAPETLARCIADCGEAQTLRGIEGYEATGREFWMVRQAGRLLGFRPLTVQIGDDGKVRFGA